MIDGMIKALRCCAQGDGCGGGCPYKDDAGIDSCLKVLQDAADTLEAQDKEIKELRGMARGEKESPIGKCGACYKYRTEACALDDFYYEEIGPNGYCSYYEAGED